MFPSVPADYGGCPDTRLHLALVHDPDLLEESFEAESW